MYSSCLYDDVRLVTKWVFWLPSGGVACVGRWLSAAGAVSCRQTSAASLQASAGHGLTWSVRARSPTPPIKYTPGRVTTPRTKRITLWEVPPEKPSWWNAFLPDNDDGLIDQVYPIETLYLPDIWMSLPATGTQYFVRCMDRKIFVYYKQLYSIERG